jgi:hypothetical protein
MLCLFGRIWQRAGIMAKVNSQMGKKKEKK